MSKNPSSISVSSYAKVNLFLDVRGRRPDGYHEILTLMHEISLHDRLTFTAIPRGIRLQCDSPEVPCDSSNLAWRAAGLLKRRSPGHGGVHIRIEKRIPPGGGLGGGSSNAAATLRGLNRLWGLGLRREELEALAARIGSDVPFFVRGRAAVCRGRGEIVQPVRLEERYYYVLVLPGFPVSTPDVYANLRMTLTSPKGSARLQHGVMVMGETNARKGAIMPYNRLESSAFRLYPVLRRLKKEVLAVCPQGALLSGSGSSLFGICRTRREAWGAREKLSRRLKAKLMVVQGRP